jgi:hypothetical protein
MEFSISDLPPVEFCPQGLHIVEAGEGRLGLFGLLANLSSGMYDLCYYIKGNKCKSSSQWHLDCVGSIAQIPKSEYFSADVKRFQLEMVCRESSGLSYSKTWIYTNFPP